MSAATPRAPYRIWGDDLDPEAIAQMERACALPVAHRGALMPDAHRGYGLPIGGVLATRGAVIPYAVGVDIACRVKLTVVDLPPDELDQPRRLQQLRAAIEKETRFGIGARFETPREHPVMDRDWTVSPVTESLKDKARSQLGTSGSGNHFVEFGVFEVGERVAAELGVPAGRHLALLSHSGSRGAGAAVASHYSKLARRLRPGLPKESAHLAWLDLDSEEGAEYWAAMQLMGEYAAANHACIHRALHQRLGMETLLDVENHHNFAWLEEHDGETLVVHRKGATPASRGALGVIPGTMADPAYLVRGLGRESSLASAAHGAGRVMSRTAAKKRLHWDDAHRTLDERRVTLISAGLDEVPAVYKRIDEVMAAQSNLVETLGTFRPRLVKMAPGGRAED